MLDEFEVTVRFIASFLYGTLPRRWVSFGQLICIVFITITILLLLLINARMVSAYQWMSITNNIKQALKLSNAFRWCTRSLFYCIQQKQNFLGKNSRRIVMTSLLDQGEWPLRSKDWTHLVTPAHKRHSEPQYFSQNHKLSISSVHWERVVAVEPSASLSLKCRLLAVELSHSQC